MNSTITKSLLMLTAVATAAACGDSGTDPPDENGIPDVAGTYSFNNTNQDPSCSQTVPHPQILDGPANSNGRVEVKQSGSAVDIEILELDGRSFSAAQSDSLSIVGTINETGSGPISRTLSFVTITQDSSTYYINQQISGTAVFSPSGAGRTLQANITFQSEYRADSVTAPVLATCSTVGTLFGQSE